ncbi:MAG: methyltransferase domain-containing protein [Mycobacterium sp.]
MSTTPTHAGRAPKSAADWDSRYASAPQLFSGHPNHALITEVSGLEPGRALDVGCGEGADAIWLAEHGWNVTAVDVSQVALERAALRATHLATPVQWVQAGLADLSPAPEGYDLVTALYPALPSSTAHAGEHALLNAVAPKGLLLVVFHAGFDGAKAREHGIDPADYVMAVDVVTALLGGDWQVHIDTKRPREMPPGAANNGHTDDVVIRARRLR